MRAGCEVSLATSQRAGGCLCGRGGARAAQRSAEAARGAVSAKAATFSVSHLEQRALSHRGAGAVLLHGVEEGCVDSVAAREGCGGQLAGTHSCVGPHCACRVGANAVGANLLGKGLTGAGCTASVRADQHRMCVAGRRTGRPHSQSIVDETVSKKDIWPKSTSMPYAKRGGDTSARMATRPTTTTHHGGEYDRLTVTLPAVRTDAKRGVGPQDHSSPSQWCARCDVGRGRAARSSGVRSGVCTCCPGRYPSRGRQASARGGR